jgi:hypothetical protein
VKIQSHRPAQATRPQRGSSVAETDRFTAGQTQATPTLHPLRQQRLQLLDSLIAEAPGLTAASPAERKQLQDSLDCVDSGVLRYLSKAGVGFLVLHQGDDLTQSRLLRQQSLDGWRQQLPALQAAGRELHAQRQASGDFSLQRLTIPCSLYRPHNDSPLGARLTTMEMVALHHGARSDEEKRLFYGLTEELNGERLHTARQENEHKLEAHGMTRDAAHVPIDTLKHTLLFPDLYFCGPQRLLLDAHDQQTLETWHAGGSQVSFASKEGDEWNGQYLYLGDQKRVLVRDSALDSKTPVHELGHALDMGLESQDPEFYSQLHEGLSRAYNGAKSSSGSISNYALANLREYFAEGFAFYYQDGQRLKKQDPTLYALVEAACQRACQLEGIDLKTGREVRREVQELPLKVSQSLEQMAAQPEATREQLGQVSQTLKRTALQSGLQAVSYGLLAGAADAVLRFSLGQPTPDQQVADLDLEQLAGSAEPKVTFEAAYQLGSQILR